MEAGRRFEALDLLRGLAIIGMAWAGMLPDTLPAWMYHGQLPPPNHIFNDQIFGITWVDLVFPMFLFSMGAAMPLALQRRLDKGNSVASCVIQLLARAVLIAALSIFVKHLGPDSWSQTPDSHTWKIGLIGFGLIIAMFIRWPKPIPVWLGRLLTLAAWAGAVWLIHDHRFADSRVGFARDRIDIILIVLANVAASGGVIWIFTRCRPLVRVGISAAVALIFLTQSAAGSLGKLIWNFTPLQFSVFDRVRDKPWFPIFYHFEYHKYLLIVLPGTLCGDIILRRLQRPAPPRQPEVVAAEPETIQPAPTETTVDLREALRRQHEKSLQASAGSGSTNPEPTPQDPNPPFSALTIRSSPRPDETERPSPRLFISAILALAAAPVACWGLFSREVLLTSAILLAAGLVVVVLSWQDEIDMPLSRLGLAFVFLGLLAEPLGGGIRKDEPTLSYFFLTAGLGFWLVLGLGRLCEIRLFRRAVSPLTMTGQNPILAYCGITNLVGPVVGLTGFSALVVNSRLGADPWLLALADGGVRVVFLVAVVVLFTKLKLFLRA
jgi:predicted acyltransferase